MQVAGCWWLLVVMRQNQLNILVKVLFMDVLDSWPQSNTKGTTVAVR